MSSLQYEVNYKPKTDFLKAVAIGASILGGAAIINHSWVAENQVSNFFAEQATCDVLTPTTVTNYHNVI